jgi:pimeloyl-ACP methyl ester carboxylesterase
MAAIVETTLARWFTDATREGRPDIIDRVTKSYLNDDPAVHGAMWDMISELDLVSQLSSIRCPTLVLVGRFDPSTPPGAAQVLADNILDSRMHLIEKASHMAPLEKPAVVKKYVKAFLAEQSLVRSSKQ